MDASEAMEGSLFITAAEMAEILGISKPYAYKIINGFAEGENYVICDSRIF